MGLGIFFSLLIGTSQKIFAPPEPGSLAFVPTWGKCRMARGTARRAIMARSSVHTIGEGGLGLLTGAFGAALLFIGIVLLTLSLS
jgi:hypothetical protein